jgi:hypothetical protein
MHLKVLSKSGRPATTGQLIGRNVIFALPTLAYIFPFIGILITNGLYLVLFAIELVLMTSTRNRYWRSTGIDNGCQTEDSSDIMTNIKKPPESETVEVRFKDGVRKLKTFPQLSAEAFQHPDDRDAMGALQAIPVLPELIKKFSEYGVEQIQRMDNLADNIRLGPRLGADIYEKFVIACRILDVHPVPELYITNSPIPNAWAAGVSRPAISVLGGLIARLDEDEMLAVLGTMSSATSNAAICCMVI